MAWSNCSLRNCASTGRTAGIGERGCQRLSAVERGCAGYSRGKLLQRVAA